ncbi:hypothetical protein KUCAC02_004140 [Chaenocephalus aceratus]|uniref:Uncharacterized protein n=1 Tax=Chaenocephalus aceratus TaxID=36190 RepID=A0ACB9WYT3_CHAAC|nr:hypothetical protein KUCAC02_004140 [Chaenocephalus aceratus]
MKSPPPPDRPSAGETTAGSGGEKRPEATRETVKVLRFKYTDTKTLGVAFSPKAQQLHTNYSNTLHRPTAQHYTNYRKHYTNYSNTLQQTTAQHYTNYSNTLHKLQHNTTH